MSNLSEHELAEVPYLDLPVKGRCPVCSERKLALTRDQHIVCKNKSCDSQNLLARVLEESPVDVHVVKLTNREFSISHPLYENVDDLSLGCRLVHDLKYSAIPPHAPGVYYVTLSASDEWVWERRDD